MPDGESQMTYFLNFLEESGKPGVIKALARALTRDYILVAESLMFEINLAEGLYADEQQLFEAHEQAEYVSGKDSCLHGQTGWGFTRANVFFLIYILHLNL